jgi:hypothetical protein
VQGNRFDGKQLARNWRQFVSIYAVAIPKYAFSIQVQDSAIPRQTASASTGEFKAFGQANGIRKLPGKMCKPCLRT